MPRPFLVVLSVLLSVAIGCSPSGDGASGAAAVVWFTLPDGTRFSSEQLDRFDELYMAADTAYAAEDYATCIDRFDDVLAIYDGNDRVWFGRSYCQALAGQADEAIASLERGVELFGGGARLIENDRDFDSLRELPAYLALIERAEALDATAAIADPMHGDAEAGGPWTSLESIRAAFARVPQDPLASVLGTAQRQRRVHRFQRDHVAALRAFIAEHPDDSAARFAEIEALEAFDPPTPQAAEAFERFAAEHQDGPWRGVVAIRRAIEPYDDEVFGDADHPDHDTAFAVVVAAARDVVADHPDAPGSRDAWWWLVRDGLRRSDAETVRPAYAALETHWADDTPFWDAHRDHLSMARFVAQGPPDFETSTLDGEPISLASLRGQVVLLDFWATWCGPCLEQLPDLKALYAEHHAAGFEIVGISADHVDRMDEATFRQWITDEAMTWPQIYTGEGWEQALYQEFGIDSIPTTVLLDRRGQVAGVDLYGDALRDTVASLL